MKIIETNGGPLIGVPRGFLHLWLGIDGKGFVGAEAAYTNDYMAAGKLTSGIDHPPCDAAVLDGIACQAIVISRPLETAVIASDGISAHLAQIKYADPNWTFSDLSMGDFENAMVMATVEGIVHFTDDSIIFFDAAYPGTEIAENHISLNLKTGYYQIESNCFSLNEETSLLLFRIPRI